MSDPVADRAPDSAPVKIGRLRRADLPAVPAIERDSFDAPWSVAMFLSEMSRPDSICLASKIRERLVGYLVCSRYDRAWHLNNIAVVTELRGRGIGSSMIRAMLEETGDEDEVTLEVRASNAAARGLYGKFGFEAVGRRPRYYPDNREDAVIMTRPGSPRPAEEEGPIGPT